MTTVDDRGEDEFLAVSRRALSTDGAAALRSLGWWDLLPQVDDDQLRPAVFAMFRAQGHELAGSSALAGLLAQPYLDLFDGRPGRILAAAPQHSPRRGIVSILVGDLDDQGVLVDRPGLGAAVLEREQVVMRRLELPGRLPVHEVDLGASDWKATISERVAAGPRARSYRLGRVATAMELLGLAEGAVDVAIEYATIREQFGQPIGRYQAVRHLLAWARTDCIAIQNVVGLAVRLGDPAPGELELVAKALAGRNARRACQRTLQVLGGIGFTAEHVHHHFHSRVLLLDSLLGSSSKLTHELGASARAAGGRPLPAEILLQPR
jgi:hypothetical protein